MRRMKGMDIWSRFSEPVGVETDLLKINKILYISGKHCIKCPPEKILIAKRGLDGVLVDLPQLTNCNDQPISKSLYELESLFSHKHSFILPKGHHSFMGQIVSKKNYTVEHICHLKYKIIVRTCGPFIPQNEGVKVKCDIGDIWGSKCTFFCKNNGILTHREPVYCNDNLQWIGTEPSCIMQHSNLKFLTVNVLTISFFELVWNVSWFINWNWILEFDEID
jgi:hypothetical protein